MAQTPWGELAVHDAHVHFFSHAFYAGLARQKKAENAEALAPLLGWEIPVADPVALAGRWVAELDRHSVKRAALIASMQAMSKAFQARLPLIRSGSSDTSCSTPHSRTRSIE